ncbi:MAG: glycosyltransferase [Planctomycetes bacterium]|nr:glycosyltransferase [Planctomycetota bacterium]
MCAVRAEADQQHDHENVSLTSTTTDVSTASIPFVRPSDHDLTLVIPAYNEESRLPKTLTDAAAYLNQWGLDYRVLVVDDGSQDNTATLAAAYGPRFSTIRQPNGGKGSAVRKGLLAATGRVVAFTDADLPYDLIALRNAYDIVQAGQADAVFGSRDMNDSSSLVERKFWRTVASAIFRGIVTFLVSRQIRDTQCGLKIFSRQAAHGIFSRSTINGFAFDAEAVFLAHCLKLRIHKVPVTLVNEYATTISLSRNAIPMLLDVVRVRWQALRGEYNFQDDVLIPSEQIQTPTRAAA